MYIHTHNTLIYFVCTYMYRISAFLSAVNDLKVLKGSLLFIDVMGIFTNRIYWLVVSNMCSRFNML